jgi:hypothetical protein
MEYRLKFAPMNRAWEQFRKRSNPGSLLVGLAAVAVIVIGVWVVLDRMQGPASPPFEPTAREWYYDMNTRELFASDRGQVPPIAAPSGGAGAAEAGVLAHVYACGACDGPNADRQIVYLESFTPDARQKLVQKSREYEGRYGIKPTIDMLMEMSPQLQDQRLVMRPAQSTWAPWPTAAGDVSTALNSMAEDCRGGGRKLTACFPADR